MEARRTRVDLRVDGRDVVVHAIPTGTVTIKRAHMTGVLPESAPYPVRMAAILADRRFAPPMPIWTFAIVHADGVVVVDTGTAPSYDDRSTWAGLVPADRMLHSFLRLAVDQAATLPAQLADLGIDPATDVADVVLTHQHVDHTETVPAFQGATVWTAAADEAAADRIGSFPARWRPADGRVRHVDVEGGAGELGPTVVLVPGIEAVHTPGHTPGSLTVRIAAEQGEVLLTGDTSFSAEGMDPCAPTAGIHVDVRAVRDLHRRLGRRGACLLPSHDPGNADRLEALAR